MLVDNVYQVFKNDYFPGETVFLRGIDNNNNVSNNSTNNKEHSTKQRGTIREKVQYGQDQPTKYLVVRLNDNHQAIVTEQNISRDRNHFTKWLIKTFIKLTMSRSYKVGAPWVVKTKYAKNIVSPLLILMILNNLLILHLREILFSFNLKRSVDLNRK